MSQLPDQMVLKSESIDLSESERFSKSRRRSLKQSFLNDKLSHAFRILKLKRSLYKLGRQKQASVRRRVRRSMLGFIEESSDLVTFDPDKALPEKKLPWETYSRKRKSKGFL